MKNEMKIGLVCDEGGDLPKEIVEKYEIEVLPFKLDLGQLEKFEGNIYQKLRKADKEKIKAFVKTSQASPKEFFDAFKKRLEKFERIICITISSKLSGSFNSALQGKKFLGKDGEKICVIDSLNGSGGEGLLILKTLELIEKKIKFEEIIKRIKKLIPKIQLIGMVKDPKWLEAGGRLPHLFALWIRKAAKLNIHPLLQIKKGRILPSGLVKAKTIPLALFKEFKKRNQKIEGKIKAIITHAGDLGEAQSLREMIEKEFKNVQVLFLNLIGPALGGHLGPGTLILAWIST